MGCQRWRQRHDSYHPSGETIDPSRYGVEVIPSDREAKEFVTRHHYSGTYPAARLRVGLYRTRAWVTPELVGVAVFSVPMSQAVIPKWTGLEPRLGIELGRFVLLDDVPGNGETWFLARAFKMLRRELREVLAVVSFSDPVERLALDGRVVTPGHVGTIYQAFNGRHVGRSLARVLLLDARGREVCPRAVSKVRNGEQGEAYAYQQLLDAGAPRREVLEGGDVYVKRALRELRRVRHPGNLAYVWPLSSDPALKLLPLLAYPKAREAIVREENKCVQVLVTT